MWNTVHMCVYGYAYDMPGPGAICNQRNLQFLFGQLQQPMQRSFFGDMCALRCLVSQLFSDTVGSFYTLPGPSDSHHRGQNYNLLICFCIFFCLRCKGLSIGSTA